MKEVVSIFSYKTMRETLNERIPEVLETSEYTEMVDFWNGKEMPMYCYYELLEHLFLKLLTGKIKDDSLLERVLDFMEGMANSDDIEVQNLLQVQILEALFGLEYDIFTNMEKRLFRSSTKALFDKIKPWFNLPKPPV